MTKGEGDLGHPKGEISPNQRPQILLGDKQIELSSLFLELPKYLEKSGLSASDRQSFQNWFHREVDSRVKREEWFEQQGHDPDSLKQYPEIANEVLVELSQRVAEHKREKKLETPDEKRLIPFLLTKAGAKRKITSSLESLHTETLSGKQRRVVVVNMDLDNLKIINDTHNHTVGDVALKFFGLKLKEAFRPGPNASAVHYSGDEFGLIIEMDFDDTLDEQDVDKRIRERISQIISDAEQSLVKEDIISRQEREYREEQILDLYGRRKTLQGEEREAVLQHHKSMVQKITHDTGKQSVSSGYVVIKKGDITNVDRIQAKADEGANLSKLIPYLEIVRAMHPVAGKEDAPPEQKETLTTSSADRVINAKDVSVILEKYSEKEVQEADLIRHLNRAAQELAPNVSNIDRVRMMLASPRLLIAFSEAKTEHERLEIWHKMKRIEQILSK